MNSLLQQLFMIP
jgi:ubiquitin carboxyl-terminal hydrolase 9/24